jgi:hypothetical protein
LNRGGVAEIELARRADHHHLPLAALALLLLQQTPPFSIQPQQESWIGSHLGLRLITAGSSG